MNAMKRHSRRRAAWLAAASVFALTAGCATTAVPVEPPAGLDGLRPRPVRGLDAVLVRPGVDFTVYKTVVIEPLEIAFHRNWDPNRDQRNLARRLSAEDIAGIKADMAREFRAIFVDELTTAGYRVVEQAGDDTMQIKPALADVYINAPDVMSPGVTRMYTMNAGEMTLELEVRDGPTGQLLARVVDREEDPDTGTLQITNSVTNAADFRRAVKHWAKRLRVGLEQARVQPQLRM
jgi:hypothetical protein